MKKQLSILALAMVIAVGVNAQKKTEVVKDETKVKKTSTIPQKVHNTFSKHKHHSGVKVKHVKEVKKETTS
ncbi:MAG: hypothetical protein H0X33_06835 [Taibaiella sp.]|nr:hypothetical protein [Taibaiella sp.]